MYGFDKCFVVQRFPIRKVDSIFDTCLKPTDGEHASGDDPRLVAEALGIGIFFGSSKADRGRQSNDGQKINNNTSTGTWLNSHVQILDHLVIPSQL